MIPATTTIIEVCNQLTADNVDDARRVLQNQYPFIAPQLSKRAYKKQDSMAVFMRDGFIDRYSGAQLIFPGTLRLIHLIAPLEFPFQKNWKMTETHIAFWDLLPTVDHLVPIARGAPDNMGNWMTTSQLRNSAKSNWTLEELGWRKHPEGDLSIWDGLTSWFQDYIAGHPEHLSDSYIRAWRAKSNSESVIWLNSRSDSSIKSSNWHLRPSPHFLSGS
jgi:5-methylcytosine-specific restriction endonuclease McrA